MNQDKRDAGTRQPGTERKVVPIRSLQHANDPNIFRNAQLLFDNWLAVVTTHSKLIAARNQLKGVTNEMDKQTQEYRCAIALSDYTLKNIQPLVEMARAAEREEDFGSLNSILESIRRIIEPAEETVRNALVNFSDRLFAETGVVIAEVRSSLDNALGKKQNPVG